MRPTRLTAGQARENADEFPGFLFTEGIPTMIRDRIVELRRVPARDLALTSGIGVGIPTDSAAPCARCSRASATRALLAREGPDGGLLLIDGHLRAEVTPDTEVPVLVLDVDEAEAGRLLATLDPLAGEGEDPFERQGR